MQISYFRRAKNVNSCYVSIQWYAKTKKRLRENVNSKLFTKKCLLDYPVECGVCSKESFVYITRIIFVIFRRLNRSFLLTYLLVSVKMTIATNVCCMILYVLCVLGSVWRSMDTDGTHCRYDRSTRLLPCLLCTLKSTQLDSLDSLVCLSVCISVQANFSRRGWAIFSQKILWQRPRKTVHLTWLTK